MLLKNTAGENLQKLLDKFFDYRATQVEKLNSDPELTIGDVTTVNVTMMSGGVQVKSISAEYS